MLEARGLSKAYASVPAAKEVTFSLSPGQVLSCLGRNGSGKSTTVKMLTGLLEPTRGKGFIRGARYPTISWALESVSAMCPRSPISLTWHLSYLVEPDAVQ
jgi:ABC-type multidrug transport system ATPase subunit